MIKVKKGKFVLKGSEFELMREFGDLVQHIKKMLLDNGYSEEAVRETIVELARLNTLSKEEMAKELWNKLEEFTKKLNELNAKKEEVESND